MESLLNLDTKAIIEILIIAIVIYLLMNFLRGTRGAGILKGTIFFLISAVLALILTTGYFKLSRIDYLLSRFLAVAVIAIIVIFQPELRRGLVRLGQNPLFGFFFRDESRAIDEIVRAVATMSKKKIGALITIVREVGLEALVEGAVRLDAELTAELLETIFWPGSPLHDGAVIIQNLRVRAASCVLPLTDNPSLSKSVGTRHRAGIGISEETDAISVIVSEETGTISVAVRGQISSGHDIDSLRTTLQKLMFTSKVRTNAEVKETAKDSDEDVKIITSRKDSDSEGY